MKILIKTLLVGLSILPMQVATAEAPKYSPEMICLAKNIYHEARGESLRGQLAVAKVTINRVASGKFKDTICGVVYQKRQFSWTKDKHKPILEWSAWMESLRLARLVVMYPQVMAFDAMYFHSKHIKPGWKNLTKIDKIGNHVFYI